MLKKVHIKIKNYIFRKHFQKKDKEFIKNMNYIINFSMSSERLFRYTLVTVKEPIQNGSEISVITDLLIGGFT